MKNNSYIIETVLTLVITILLVIITPILIFWGGYFGGWILMNLVGERIADGFNLLFNTTRFTRDFIPLTCGVLATVGSYFTSSSTRSKR